MTSDEWSAAHRSARRSATLCVAALERTSDNQAAVDAFRAIEFGLRSPEKPSEPEAFGALEPVGDPIEFATAFTPGTTRDDLYDAARAAIGTHVAFETPWERVEKLLAALNEAWGHDHTALLSAAADSKASGASMLPHGHRVAYEIARSHVAGLCATAPFDHWSGYAEVLEKVDALHAPWGLVRALPLLEVTRPVMRAAAVAAIQRLSTHGLDPDPLLAARDRLDAVWASERPGVTT